MNYLILIFILLCNIAISFGWPDQATDLTYGLISAGNKYGSNEVSNFLHKVSTSDHKANLSNYIDKTCQLIKVNDKLDVINLSDTSGRFLLMNSKFYNGKLNGLRTIKRNGDCYVNYEAEYLLLVTKFYFQQVKMSCSLKSKFLIFNMKYKMEATMKDLTLETVFRVDASNMSATVDRLVIPSISKINIDLSGHGIIAWFMDKLAATYTFVFQKSLKNHIQNALTDSVQELLDNLPYYRKNDPIPVSPYCAS